MGGNASKNQGAFAGFFEEMTEKLKAKLAKEERT
jgi:hypothetical protein